MEREVIEGIIRKSLANIRQFQTRDGLFKTYRMDYSQKACPNDHIDENRAKLIDTKYDHAFILDILMDLREYFPSEASFKWIMESGIKHIMDEAIVTTQAIGGRARKTLQWRHYNIPHNNGKVILPDIDNTGRRLMVIEKYGIMPNPDTHWQFWSTLYNVGDDFRPNGGHGPFEGLMTHFGHKPGNDVDPICNIIALQSQMMFFDMNPSFMRAEDIKNMKMVGDFLGSFLMSGVCERTHEYYEPVVVAYCFSKFWKSAAN